MANTIGTAYIQIEPTTQGISGKISSALNGEAAAAGTSAGGKLSSALGSAAKIGAGALVGLTTAAVGVGTAIASSAVKTAEYGDNIDKMSQKLGVSSTFYQEWDAVLQHSGTSMDSMSATFKKLATASQDASDDQKAAFEALGLSMKDVQSMSTEDLFTSVISGLQGMDEGTERTALATELLGRGAMEMGALLNTSAEDTQGMIDTVRELGGVMSDDAVKGAAAFQDSMQDFQTSISGAMNNAMSSVLPSMTQILDGFTGLITGSDDAKEKLQEGFSGLAEGISQALPSLVEGFSTFASVLAEIAPELISALLEAIISNLPQLLVSGVQIILTIVTSLLEALPQLIEAIPQIVIGIKDAFIVAAPQLKEAGIKLIDTLKVAISNAWSSVKDKAGELISQLKTAFINKVRAFTEVGKQMVEGIKQGFADAWDSVKEWLKGMIGNVVNWAKEILGIHSPSKVMAEEVGQWIPAGIAQGISDNIGAIHSAMNGVSSELMNEGLNARATFDAAVNTNSDLYRADNIETKDEKESEIIDMLRTYLPVLAQGNNVNVTLQGDARSIFRAVRNENDKFIKATGFNALA